jgi:purine nucleosidase
MTSRRVIIDTDPGLDDAVAILFALNCGHFEILGLTTMAGNIGIETTTRNAGRLLAAMGRSDIPVITGAPAPLIRQGIDEAAIHGDDGLGGVTLPDPSRPARRGATAWIAEQLETAPAGAIDILALGPLTNLARVVLDYPDAAKRIGRLVVMGGAVLEKGNVGPHSEFNFASDPEAVDVILRAGLPLTLIPLDVTRKVRASRDYVASLRRGATIAGNTSADLIDAYFTAARESRPLHDPCVMLYALAPELFTLERRSVSIDLGLGPDAGALLERAGAGTVDIAMGVDAAGVLALLTQGLR